MINKFKASLIICLMLITLISSLFNVNAVSDSNKAFICNSGNPPIANFTIDNDSEKGYVNFDGSLSYDSDGEIITYEWDFGNGAIGEGIYSWYQYCDHGIYNVTLTVTDNDGLTGNLTKSLDVLLVNFPPPSMEIYGPESGKTGTEYEYRFSMFCQYEAAFYVLVDWGDENNTGWFGPVIPFDPVYLSHSWSEEGKFTIKAKAKDQCEEGYWTEFEVTMPRDKSIQNTLFLKFLEQFPLLQKLLNFLEDNI